MDPTDTTQETPRGMRPREFARVYGMAPSSVYQALNANKIPHIRVGGRIVILARQFEQMAQRQGSADDAV